MENQNQTTENQLIKKDLPNSTGVLVLGILSIVFCFCYGIFGIVFGIISLVLASKDGKLYENSPSTYTESSFKNMKGGKVCAIVGLSLSSVYILIVVIYLAIFGAAIGAGILEALNEFPQ
jgi:hypothetical protein